jgi:hypothetical protein
MQEISRLERIAADPLARTAGCSNNNVGLFQESRASDSSILFPCQVLGANLLRAESCEGLDGGGDLGRKFFRWDQDKRRDCLCGSCGGGLAAEDRVDDWEEVGQSLARAGLGAGWEMLVFAYATTHARHSYQECPFRSAQAVESQPGRV